MEKGVRTASINTIFGRFDDRFVVGALEDAARIAETDDEEGKTWILRKPNITRLGTVQRKLNRLNIK